MLLINLDKPQADEDIVPPEYKYAEWDNWASCDLKARHTNGTETSVQPFYNVHPALLSTVPNRSYYSTIGSFFVMAVFYNAVQDYHRLSDCYIETKQKLLVGINRFFIAYEYRVVDQ